MAYYMDEDAGIVTERAIKFSKYDGKELKRAIDAKFKKKKAKRKIAKNNQKVNRIKKK